MNATNVLAAVILPRNTNGSLITPIWTSTELIGPFTENNVKNNIAKAEAMIRFGK